MFSNFQATIQHLCRSGVQNSECVLQQIGVFSIYFPNFYIYSIAYIYKTMFAVYIQVPFGVERFAAVLVSNGKERQNAF